MSTKTKAKARQPRAWTGWVWLFDARTGPAFYDGQAGHDLRELPYIYEDRDSCEHTGDCRVGRAIRVRVTEVLPARRAR